MNGTNNRAKTLATEKARVFRHRHHLDFGILTVNV